jgi:hypothetical protein
MRLDLNATGGEIDLRSKKTRQMARQRMLEPGSGAELSEAGELFAAARIQGNEAYLLAWKTRDAATREHAYGKVDRHCSRMKQVQGPDIHGPAGQVYAAGRMNGDGLFRGQLSGGTAGVWQVYSVKKCAIWRNLL